MESSNLTPSPSDDVALETWLRTNSRLAQLPDAGFTTRVVTALPRPDRHHFHRWWFSLAGLIVGSTIAVAGILHSGETAEMTTHPIFEGSYFVSTILTTLAVTISSLLYAFRDELQRIVRSCF